MLTKAHLNPLAPERPSNMVFLRDLLLDFRDNDEMIVGGCKKVSIKHFYTSVNPITVCLNLCSKNPVYQLKHIPGPEQHLQRMWTPMGCYFSSQSKTSSCLQVKDCAFWNKLYSYNRSCERFIGQMSSCLHEVIQVVHERRGEGTSKFGK